MKDMCRVSGKSRILDEVADVVKQFIEDSEAPYELRL